MNIKKLIPSKNNTFISWLASYSVILIVPWLLVVTRILLL